MDSKTYNLRGYINGFLTFECICDNYNIVDKKELKGIKTFKMIIDNLQVIIICDFLEIDFMHMTK